MALSPRADEAPVSTARLALGYAGIIGLCAASMVAFRYVVIWMKDQHYGFEAVLGATVVYAAVLLTLVWTWSRSRAAAGCMSPSPAARRYRNRQMVAAVLYVAAIILALAARFELHATGVIAYASVLLIVAPIIGMVAAMGLYLKEETDEVERSLHVESALWAMGAVMALAAGWGFLEMFELAPHLQAWLVFPLWALLLGVAKIFVRRRYR